MKMKRFLPVLLTLVLAITLMAPALAEEAYGADRLTEERPYEFHELLRAVLEETRFRLSWLEQAAISFRDEPLFAQELEAERERERTMLQLFAAWGFTGEPADPPQAPEVPTGPEQALHTMRSLAERAMLMSRRMEGLGDAAGEVRAWAHTWGHEYRQQLDDCDLKAEGLGYQWAWQYDEGEGDREQIQLRDSIQGNTEPDGEQNREQNQQQNGEQNQGADSPEGESQQNGNGNGSQDSGNGKKGN